jgi:hypothetical protein
MRERMPPLEIGLERITSERYQSSSYRFAATAPRVIVGETPVVLNASRIDCRRHR